MEKIVNLEKNDGKNFISMPSLEMTNDVGVRKEGKHQSKHENSLPQGKFANTCCAWCISANFFYSIFIIPYT